MLFDIIIVLDKQKGNLVNSIMDFSFVINITLIVS